MGKKEELNAKRAVSLLSKEALQILPEALLLLSYCYWEGIGVNHQDLKKAKELLEEAQALEMPPPSPLLMHLVGLEDTPPSSLKLEEGR